ncbi:MAG: hypothetical protein II464_06385, partial [Oscillospiraceae bacterium]|nr:hypothetical protein [Oscillospiraceae bacterium]
QLKINQLAGEGVRMKDMPEEWFEVPQDADMSNYLVAYNLIARENRLLDSLDLARAEELIDRMIADGTAIPDLYRALLLNDKVFLDLLKNGKEADVSVLEQKEVAAVLRQMKTFPSVLRTRYAEQLLCRCDEAKAQEILAEFEKVSLTYPSPADIESERELIKTAAECRQQEN